MNKSLYYIECVCIKDTHYPNVDFHVGDVLYYTPKAASHEMYYYSSSKSFVSVEEANNIRRKWCHESYLPLTRKKQYAKRWQVKSAAQHACIFIDKSVFEPVIKEIKITYTEEEI